MEISQGLRPLLYKLLWNIAHKKLFKTLVSVGGFRGYVFTKIFDHVFSNYVFPAIAFLEKKGAISIDIVKVQASVENFNEAENEQDIVDAFNNLA